MDFQKPIQLARCPFCDGTMVGGDDKQSRTELLKVFLAQDPWA